MTGLRAGAIYFLLTFALGFALGTVRTLLVAPAVGETGAVLLELPVMLAAAWAICRFTLARIPVPRPQRPAMTAIFIALLLAAEIALGLALGRSLQAVTTAWLKVPGSIGLAAQLLAAAFPLLQRAR